MRSTRCTSTARSISRTSVPVKVALIDTAIDESHPDLAGAVAARFDAIGGAGAPRSLDHGTAMAGAIAARGRLRGVASNVKLLSARAFDTDGAGGALGSSFSVMKGLDWAAHAGARVVNMSFAGPQDPALHDLLTAAAKKGLILVSAMGNAGPKSPPLYPGADENVIAITATDAEDRLYAMANVGAYVAVGRARRRRAAAGAAGRLFAGDGHVGFLGAGRRASPRCCWSASPRPAGRDAQVADSDGAPGRIGRRQGRARRRRRRCARRGRCGGVVEPGV